MARVLITGAAGFIGSHLSIEHIKRGDEVIGIDNFCTGKRGNLKSLMSYKNFSLIESDVVAFAGEIDGPLDFIYHMASPASPPRYMALANETMSVNTEGTKKLISLAGRKNARILFASTSEVYGDPVVHPQVESYWGNVNPVGPRSIYDEAKRFGETLMSSASRLKEADTVLIRIFNTFGPHMDPYDGRVVSTFIRQALLGEKTTIYGSGLQTRSFCYVSDLVRGVMLAMESNETGPINLGNPYELNLLELLELISEVVGTSADVEFLPLPEDDPKQRKPDISLAKETLAWEPEIAVREGIAQTVSWMRELLGKY